MEQLKPEVWPLVITRRVAGRDIPGEQGRLRLDGRCSRDFDFPVFHDVAACEIIIARGSSAVSLALAMEQCQLARGWESERKPF